jgi:hypothetical protein
MLISNCNNEINIEDDRSFKDRNFVSPLNLKSQEDKYRQLSKKLFRERFSSIGSPGSIATCVTALL